MFAEHDIYPTTIAGTSLSTRAWFCRNAEQLLVRAPRRRFNIQMAGVGGVLGRPPLPDERVVDLLFEMDGDVEPDGTPHTDIETGLAVNKRTFEASFLDATTDAFGAVEVEIEDRDGTVYGGRLQVDEPIWGEGLTETSFSMTVVLVDGELAPVGS